MAENFDRQWELVTHEPITIEYDGKHVIIDERELVKKGFQKSNLKYLRNICNAIYDSKAKILELENEGEIWWVEDYNISFNKYKSLLDDMDISFEHNISDYEYEAFRLTGSFRYFGEEKRVQIYIINQFLEKYIRNGKYIDINGKEIHTLNLKGEM